jgi:hypothetical protein
VANLFQRGFQKFADVVGHVVFLALLLAHLLRNRFPAPRVGGRDRSLRRSRSTAFSASSRLFDLNGEANRARKEAEQRDHRAVMLGDSVT